MYYCSEEAAYRMYVCIRKLKMRFNLIDWKTNTLKNQNKIAYKIIDH